ncbi:hypothetical protein B0T20DRAFT_349408 [Sordaria brevicollis]|uniref:Ankyrin repeat protein n=1 Tax=Sordaria brevicollis TaxID=83679 RepID=A0AAE0PGW9_SORBR|nr:hypothetical protein B0T20DRAFT_349408 [Sordaria brevicollis]
MGLLHRSRDKDGLSATPKPQSGFRKSLKRFTGSKSSGNSPEPGAAYVHRQSLVSEHSPCSSAMKDTELSLKVPKAASESLTTISNDLPCPKITTTHKTLWDRAYDGLCSSNDPTKSALMAEYETRILHGLRSNLSGEEGHPILLEETYLHLLQDPTFNKQAALERAAKDAMKHAEEKGSAKSFMDKAGTLAMTLQNFISEAVKASPEASLVWAGVCLILPLLTQPVIADEAQRNGFSYVTSRISFWTTLERQFADAGNWMESIQEGFIALYQLLLEFQVRTVLRYHQGGFERFVQDISSNVWEQLVMAVKDQEGLLYQDLQQYHNTNLALTIESLKENSDKSLQSNARFLDALQEVRDFVRKGAESRLQEKEQKCLHLFRLTENGRNATYEWYKSRIQNRVEGTCVWAVEHENFQHWLHIKSGPLLITADPGCGKSVLSKYLVDRYLPQRFPTAAICYYFFKDGDQNTVKQALCAILHQLFCQKPGLLKHAMGEYRLNGDGLTKTISALWNVFNNATHDEQAGSIIIVLDALDECESAEFASLVESLTLTTRQDGVKLFLTSRPYGDVVFPFEHCNMLDRFPHVRIPGEKDDQSDKISDEINIVIQVRVDEFAEKYRLNPQLKETLWTELRKTPHRTYLWVFLVFDHLEALMSSSMLKRTSRGFKMAMTQLPRTVSDAYERMLNRSGEGARAALRRALSVLLVAQRPLRVHEFKVVLNMEPHITSFDELDLEENDIDFELRLRAMCGLFLSVHREKVYFLHQTAREFLLAESAPSAASPDAWHHSITEREAHSELARVTAEDGVTDLHVAAALGCGGLVQYCLRVNGIKDINTAQSYWKSTPLALAARYGHAHVFSALIEAGAEVENGWKDATPLWEAVAAGHIEPVVRLLDYGASCDQLDALGQTLLHTAAYWDDVEMLQLLMRKGVNVNSRDHHGNSVLLAIVSRSHESKRPNEDKWAWGARNRQRMTDGTKSAKALIQMGADPDIVNKDGTTAIMAAIKKKMWNLAKILVEQGANTSLQNCEGQLALHLISWYGDEEHEEYRQLFTALVERCFNLETKDNAGRTPLHVAASEQNTEVVKLLVLVAAGANIDATDWEGKTPLFMAVARADLEIKPAIVQSLINLGAKVESIGQGPSALKKITEDAEGLLKVGNAIMREYELFKQRTSTAEFLDLKTRNWDLANDTEEMEGLRETWRFACVEGTFKTYKVICPAATQAGIDGLDSDLGTNLERIYKLVREAMREMEGLQEERPGRFKPEEVAL